MACATPKNGGSVDPGLEDRLLALESEVGSLQAQVESDEAQIADLQAQVAADADLIAQLQTQADQHTEALTFVDSLSEYVSVASGSVYVTGANLYLQSGAGATDGNPDDGLDASLSPSVNGFGNLVVGY